MPFGCGGPADISIFASGACILSGCLPLGQGQFHHALGDVDDAGVYGAAVDIGSVFPLLLRDEPVGQTRGPLQVPYVSVGLVAVHQHAYGAGGVLYAEGVVPRPYAYGVVQQVEKVFEPVGELGVQLLVGEIPGGYECRVEAVPALDVRGGFLGVFPGTFPGPLQYPLPRGMYCKDSLCLSVPVRHFYGVEPGLCQRTAYPDGAFCPWNLPDCEVHLSA